MRAKAVQSSSSMTTHKVRKLGMRGTFLLVECQNCKERNLARDKEEAADIYSKLACIE